jgi:hypothetical protein
MPCHLTLTVVILAATSANAQGFEWGVKAGGNWAWHTVYSAPPGLTGDVKVKMRDGFYAGFFAEKVFGDRIGLQGELLYSQMGSKFDVGEHSFAVKTDYVVLPVLAKLYIFNGLSLDVGPQFGYLVVARDEDNASVYDGFSPLEVSVVAGLSCKFAKYFDVSARCNFGLRKLDGVDEPKNRAISLGVGYRF